MTRRKIPPPTPRPITEGMPWVCASTPLIIGGWRFDRGCVIPDEIIMGTLNFQSLVENRRVMQVPRSRVNANVKPIKLQPEQPAFDMGRHVLLADASLDPVERWKRSVELTSATTDGSVQMARDLLVADRDGAALYKLASRIESERLGIPGRRPHVAL